MKRSSSDSSFQTSLLQALQKNKNIQGKLNEYQHTYYVKFLKDMQTYKSKEKYNRELLYAWKKESYVRQLKKDIQRRCVKDAYYEYQVQKLGDLIGGQQSLVIPHSEEERRLDVDTKYHQFLEKNPLQISPNVKSVTTPTEQSIKEGEETVHNLEDTWTHIHAKSAVGSRRKSNNIFPNIHRPSTITEVRRDKYSAKTPKTSSGIGPTSSETLHLSLDEKQLSTKSLLNDSEFLDSIEPLNITSDIINKHTHADLVTMRSVRRPRKSPFELNLLFETRKQIYQINKRTLDVQLYQRKCRLRQNIQLNRFKPREFIEESLENIPKQQSDPVIT
jgi:hypothetical protein